MPHPVQKCTNAPTAGPCRWRVVEIPDQAPEDHRFVVTQRDDAPPNDGRGWAAFREWAAGEFLTLDLAELAAALLNGERPPTRRRSSAFSLEERALFSRSRPQTLEGAEADRQALAAPHWRIRARGWSGFVAAVYSEQLAGSMMLRLSTAHLASVRAVERAMEAQFVEDDRRRLARDPLAQAFLAALRAHVEAHPRKARAALVKVDEAAQLAASVLQSERGEGRRHARG